MTNGGQSQRSDGASVWTGRSLMFSCPHCSQVLRSGVADLACTPCGRRWPLVHGVPHFISDFPYWGEIPRDSMQDVNRRAAAGNWKAALLDHPDEGVRSAAEMILNLDRANWHWLVNLPQESRVLDLGAGTGTTTHSLARYYDEVVAVEPVLERVEFMRHRFTQENVDNVTVLRSSLWQVPFAPGTFDLIALNGVLEWVAVGQQGDPQELQEVALRKTFELLRPGGYLYIGIENRMPIDYFVGAPDPHCGLPFVTVLPRPLANWYARHRGCREGYRNYLYSPRGYRNLLRRAGFSGETFYLALPSYNVPRYFIPMEEHLFAYYSANFDSASSSGARQVARALLSRLRLLKYVQNSYAIVAKK